MTAANAALGVMAFMKAAFGLRFFAAGVAFLVAAFFTGGFADETFAEAFFAAFFAGAFFAVAMLGSLRRCRVG
jgi:hypothetical protein